jgi:hypothetical protein
MVYNSKLKMTYLVITTQNNLSDNTLKSLIQKLWKKDIDESLVIKNPDFHLIDGREINSIGIEEIKDLQDEMRYKPFQEKTQIALILDAKKLTVQAQNAFLKTLEESSDTTAYILLTRNEKDLLPTISSRSKKIYSKEKNIDNIEQNEKDICFENDDMIYCFSVFEKISKGKIDTLDYLDNYLNSLQKNLREGIKKGIDIEDIANKISLVNNTKGQINTNGNRRLLLENLYLQIHNIA